MAFYIKNSRRSKAGLAPILSLKTIAGLRNKLGRVALAGGVFDIIHGGHIQHLRKAKSICDNLIIHITGDKRVRKKKGKRRPLRSERDRALTVAAIRFVDYVFIYNGRHYDQKIINAIKPDILFFNREAWSQGVRDKVGALKNFKGGVLVDRQRKVNSSSRLIVKLLRL